MATKVIITGSGGCGKTTFMKRVLGMDFDPRYEPTLGVEVRTLHINGKAINFWDCAGQEDYRGLGDGYYIGADLAIIFLDISSKLSIIESRTHFRNIRRIVPNTDIIVVGCKKDLKSKYLPSDIDCLISNKDDSYKVLLDKILSKIN